MDNMPVTAVRSPKGPLREACEDVDCASGWVRLPFDLEEVVENLRMERYTGDCQYGSSKTAWLLGCITRSGPYSRLPSAAICSACI